MASFRWAACHHASCQQFSPLESKQCSPEVGTTTPLSSLCLFFCGSPRQLVSNVYLLPFQLDRDNREAYLDRGPCHLKTMVATSEVMP